MFQIFIFNKKNKIKYPKTVFRNDKNFGFIFLEILIAIALISIVFIVLLSMGFSSVSTSSSIRKEVQVDFLVKEEFEALRSFRDGTTWATNGLGTVNFTESNPYRLFLDSGVTPPKWTLQTGTETVGIFTRYVFFDRVSRNPGTGNIESVYNGYNNDSDTIKVTVAVTWLNKTSRVVHI